MWIPLFFLLKDPGRPYLTGEAKRLPNREGNGELAPGLDPSQGVCGKHSVRLGIGGEKLERS